MRVGLTESLEVGTILRKIIQALRLFNESVILSSQDGLSAISINVTLSFGKV